MDQVTYYGELFGMSVVFTIFFIFKWHKQYDIHMTAVFMLLPVINFVYLLVYLFHDPEATVALMSINCICVMFLPLLITLCEMDLCQIQVSDLIRRGAFVLSMAVAAPFMVINELRPGAMRLEQTGTVWVLVKDYGPYQIAYDAVIVLFLLIDLGVVLYAYRNQIQVSRRILIMLFLPIALTIGASVAGSMVSIPGYEILPAAYVLTQVIYLLIVRRMAYYNVSEMVIESMAENGEIGFITVDAKGNYLGSNETAKSILPELNYLVVDAPIRNIDSNLEQVADWIDAFQRKPEENRFVFVSKGKDGSGEERIYLVNMGDLYYDGKRCGFQVFLSDDTQNQKYIQLLDRYNADLQADVEAKTEYIVSMHDKLVLSMAMMVESRDNSTGGHIRRTSEGVRLLTEAIREDGSLQLSDEFCKNIIKAAPMHDLGKIAVDDAILRKPGRFTPEEFEKMKSHTTEGQRIVHEILQDTADDAFRQVAENVAHYHHERVDGSGYPVGLKGDEIPLEARIMAIADVYDALVSKRVYKDSFSFEKADQIIMEGMGTQFDAKLERFYVAARPRLEAYYTAEAKAQ